MTSQLISERPDKINLYTFLVSPLSQGKHRLSSFPGALKCCPTALNDTPCQSGKFISCCWKRHRLSCPPGNGLNLSRVGWGWCSNTGSGIRGALPTYACVQFPCTHNTHKHRWRPLRKTCVTLCRHLDSQDQRQWCIVSRRVDRGGGGQDKTEIVLW